jgi:hypothetical protein
MSLSATSAPSSGFTRSSRPQISSTSLRSRWASRHSSPSSAVAGSKKDAPSEAAAARAAGSLAAANRSSISSSVISRWSNTSVRRNAASFSLLGPGGAANSISLLTPSVGSGANTLRLRPPGPISTSRPARCG